MSIVFTLILRTSLTFWFVQSLTIWSSPSSPDAPHGRVHLRRPLRAVSVVPGDDPDHQRNRRRLLSPVVPSVAASDHRNADPDHPRGQRRRDFSGEIPTT